MHSIEETIILDEENPLRNAAVKKWEVPIYNALDGYMFGCSQALSLLSASIDKARLAIRLLESSYKDAPKGDDLTPDEFIEYAIENYFIRSGAIYDRSLIFANKLHDLGISNESITHELLVTNSHVVNSGVAGKLKKLRRVTTEYRVERNKIVHHGRYSENTFDTVSAMHKVNNYHRLMGKDLIYKQDDIDSFTHEIIDIQVEEFKNHLDKIVSKLDDFYDVCKPIYTTKKLEYSKNITRQ